MTGGTHAQGVFAKLLLEPGASPHTFNASSEPYEFLSEDMKLRQRFIGGDEIRGTRTQAGIRVREGARYYMGTITKYISPAELDNLIPKFLGDESSDVFEPDETVPYFGMLIYRDESIFASDPSSTFEYKDCVMDAVDIRGRSPTLGESGMPDMVRATFRIIGSDTAMTAWPGSPPSLGSSHGYIPWVFSDCDSAVYLNGAAYEIEEFVISVRNLMHAKYVNSLKPHSIKPRGRIVRLGLRMPWNDTSDGLLGVTFTGSNHITFTNSTYGISTKFEFGDLYVDHEHPTAGRGKGQIALLINATSYSTTTETWDLKITNDSSTTSASTSPSASPSVSPT